MKLPLRWYIGWLQRRINWYCNPLIRYKVLRHRYKMYKIGRIIRKADKIIKKYDCKVVVNDGR